MLDFPKSTFSGMLDFPKTLFSGMLDFLEMFRAPGSSVFVSFRVKRKDVGGKFGEGEVVVDDVTSVGDDVRGTLFDLILSCPRHGLTPFSTDTKDFSIGCSSFLDVVSRG